MSHQGKIAQISDPKGFELTTTQLGGKVNAMVGDDVPMQQAYETVKVLDRSPVKKEFSTKGELEMTDKKRLADYNMYWHLKEFDEVDIVENMDLNEKYKKKQKVEKLMEKFRQLPETEQIKTYLKYERINYKTQLYNQSRTISDIMGKLNS